MMYAMTGTMQAAPGVRVKLTEILLQAADLVATLPGCRMYIVCEDAASADVVSVFEVWDDKRSHDASLTDERVRVLIGRARPLLAAPPQGSELTVAGGFGMVQGE
jgi:quinol monooxygenase YgiN